MNADKARSLTKKAIAKKNKQRYLENKKREDKRKTLIKEGYTNYKSEYRKVNKSIREAVKDGKTEVVYYLIEGAISSENPKAYGTIKKIVELLITRGYRASSYTSTGRGWNDEDTYYLGVKVSWDR